MTLDDDGLLLKKVVSELSWTVGTVEGKNKLDKELIYIFFNCAKKSSVLTSDFND